MSYDTSVEWTDSTWNPVRARFLEPTQGGGHRVRLGWHCEVASPGCTNCYAEAINRRLGTSLEYKPVQRGKVETYIDTKILEQVLGWRRQRMVFVCSMTDLFGAFVSDQQITQVFDVMERASQHTFQVLTKRAERMRRFLDERYRLDRWHRRPPAKNIWLGVSVEDQRRANERVPELLRTPAPVHFVSAEPLLEAVSLARIERTEDRLAAREDEGPWTYMDNALDGFIANKCGGTHGPKLDWVIVGGESGRKARRMEADHARALRDECAQYGTPFLFKQWGEWSEDGRRVGKKAAGRIIDGALHHAFPSEAP